MTSSQPKSSANKLVGPVSSEPTGKTKRAQRINSGRADRIEVLDNSMRVTTPENISFDYQLAGPFRRLLAYLIDVLATIAGFAAVSFLVFLLITFVLAPLAGIFGLQSLLETLVGAVVGLLLVIYFLVYWFYGAFFETCFNGQTLGKRSTGLRVLSVNGHAIDGVQATLRNFFRLLDVWPAVSLAALVDVSEFDSELEAILRAVTIPTFLVALTMMSMSRKFQRVGDLVAGTVVVTDAQTNRPSLVKFSDPRVASLAELIPQHFVPTNQLARAIASYVDLRRSIYPQRANEIAAHVAVPLLEKFGLLPDTDYDLFICSLYYKTFLDTKNIQDETSNPVLRTVSENVNQSNFLPSKTLTQLRVPFARIDPALATPPNLTISHRAEVDDEHRGSP